MSATVTVAPGLELYCRNAGEFTFRLNTIALSLAGFFLVLALAAALPQFLLRRRPRAFALTHALVLAAGTAVFLQFLTGDVIFRADPLPFDAEVFRELWWCMLLQLAMLLWPFALALWRPALVSRYGVRIAVILLAAALSPPAYRLFHHREPDYGHYIHRIDETEKFVFGTRDNVILLVVDCMSEPLFKEALRQYPELRDVFRDFTFFDRLESPLPKTVYAVPAMLSGIEYAGSPQSPEAEPHDVYLRRVCFSENSLPVRFRAAGYRVEAYPYIMQTVCYHPALLDNVTRRDDHALSLDYFFDLWLLKGVPLAAQYLLGDAYLYLSDPFVRPAENDAAHRLLPHDAVFLQDLQMRMRLGDAPDRFKYLHLQGAHGPLRTDHELKFNLETSHLKQLRGSLRCAEALLARLKELGIYDRAAIVVTGDHSERYTPEIATLVKLPHERRERFERNSVPGTVADLAGTILAAQNLGDPARSLFARERVRERGRRLLATAALHRLAGWQPEEPLTPAEQREEMPCSFLNFSYRQEPGGLTFNFPAVDRPAAVELAARLEDPVSGRRYRTATTAFAAEHRPEELAVDWAGVPDGVYVFYLLLGDPEVEVPEEEERWLEPWGFQRLVELAGGKATLHEKYPGLSPRPLLPGETLRISAFRPLPQLEFGDEWLRRESSLQMSGRAALTLRLPPGEGALQLRLDLWPVIQNPAELLITAGEAILYSGTQRPNRGQIAIDFELPPALRTAGEATLEFSLQSRLRNRDRRPPTLRIEALRLSEKGNR